jgi:archaellum component FlaF (FlaF/FlaG flagellin family)
MYVYVQVLSSFPEVKTARTTYLKHIYPFNASSSSNKAQQNNGNSNSNNNINLDNMNQMSNDDGGDNSNVYASGAAAFGHSVFSDLLPVDYEPWRPFANTHNSRPREVSE